MTREPLISSGRSSIWESQSSGSATGCSSSPISWAAKWPRPGNREYGRAVVRPASYDTLFSGFEGDGKVAVWMSHGDSIKKPPPGFTITAKSDNNLVAAIENREKRIFGVQFHPEVVHTPRGTEILRNFLFDVAGLSGLWTMRSFIETEISRIKEVVGDDRVICALSGGVDSSVVAALLDRAVGERLTCIFVDNGLLRTGEAERVKKVFQGHFGMDLHVLMGRGGVPLTAFGSHRSRKEAKDYRQPLYRALREGGRRHPRCKIPRPGDPLSGRNRERLIQGSFRHDQEPPQRRGAAGRHATRPDRAAQRALQG